MNWELPSFFAYSKSSVRWMESGLTKVLACVLWSPPVVNMRWARVASLSETKHTNQNQTGIGVIETSEWMICHKIVGHQVKVTSLTIYGRLGKRGGGDVKGYHKWAAHTRIWADHRESPRDPMTLLSEGDRLAKRTAKFSRHLSSNPDPADCPPPPPLNSSARGKNQN